MVAFLHPNTDQTLLLHAVVVLGSLALGHADALLEAQAMGPLVHLLSHTDQSVVEAALRALKLLLQSESAPKDIIFEVSEISSQDATSDSLC